MLKKILLIVSIIIGLGLIGFCALMSKSYFGDPSVENLRLWHPKYEGQNEVQLGDSIRFTGEFATSQNLGDPKLKEIQLPESWVLVGIPKFSKCPRLTGEMAWHTELLFRAVLPDTATHAICPQIRFNGNGILPDTTLTTDTLFLPAVVFEVDTTRTLEAPLLYGKVDEPKSYFFYAILLGVALPLLLILGVIIYAYKRPRAQFTQKIPSWVIAEEALLHLRADVAQSKISPERATASLSDIVRNYLTRRFGIPAQSATTEEFFQFLALHDRLIPEEHHDFLKRFSTAAEMIKFAGLAADNAMVLNALNHAEILVKETQPKREKH